MASAAMRPSGSLVIGLVSPRGPLYRHRGGIWKRSLRYAPLTLTTLASLVPEELEANVLLVDEGIGEVPEDLDADLIGISVITGTAPRAYELADGYRRRGVPVVLGGVHPTLMPEEARRHADAVVIGYAEDTWPDLLRDFVRGQMRECYVQAGDLSLVGRPQPRRDLLPAGRFTIATTVEATRGCVHGCEFCVVPTAWGRGVRHPVDEVIDDIRSMKARRVLFLDLNLIADKGYAKDLFRALIPLRVSWGGLATTLIGHDEELLDLAAESGCRGLLLGLESLSGEALKEAGKRFNQREDYRVLIDALHQRGIAVMGCFVFGFDSDDESTVEATVAFTQETHIDLPRFAILTPFPSTPLFRRLQAEGRILTTDWSLYDGQHVVFQPRTMTPEELLTRARWAWRETYRFRSMAKRLLGTPRQAGAVLAANLGYRYYARRLDRFYTCDWGRLPGPRNPR